MHCNLWNNRPTEVSASYQYQYSIIALSDCVFVSCTRSGRSQRSCTRAGAGPYGRPYRLLDYYDSELVSTIDIWRATKLQNKCYLLTYLLTYL